MTKEQLQQLRDFNTIIYDINAAELSQSFLSTGTLTHNACETLPLSVDVVSSSRGVKIPKGAKTILNTNSPVGLKFVSVDKYGQYEDTSVLIPHIADVQVIDDKVVIISFKDGTNEKAVLDKSDTYSLEQGISICITKKMLSMKTNGNGSSAYNKLLNHCLKIYEDNRKAEEKSKADEWAAKEKKKKAAEKAKSKRIKRANKEREREIEIQKEAYLRAMKELGGNSAVND